ncbi:MAG TPA: hypothetical protein VMU39_19930 [Solirubrobacteraceae bacterium]|nr:hypothetical protein [Solirubrobacteraceae bacterium]
MLVHTVAVHPGGSMCLLRHDGHEGHLGGSAPCEEGAQRSGLATLGIPVDPDGNGRER